MSYEQLTLMPADQLAQELMPAILAKYNMPMDLAHAPLFAIMQFIQECEQEQQALCSCISLCDFLEKSSLAALFPAHFMLTPLAQDKKERLHYLEQSITAICLEKIPQSSATRDDA
jgi:hypothetical protein